MGFLAPWFLAGAAAIGLPIYLHLLRRHTSPPQPFSSLMFFERRTQASIKHRRLRYLLLLSLRMALLLLLALAFAGPFLNRPAAAAKGDRLLVLVVDNSFSMRAGTRLADAKRQALAVLGARNPAQRAQVMALGSQVHVLSQPTQDGGALRAAVNSIEPGDSRGSFGELARTLRSMAETVNGPIELHLFSDMQKSALPAGFGELALPDSVSLVPHPVATEAAPNWTVESVSAPGQVWDPKKAQVEAVISGYHTPAASRTVSLVVNGRTIASRSVQVPASGRASVEFPSLDVPYGFSRCEVRIDSADSLPADDTSYFAVERSDPQPVLFIHEAGDTRSPLYFRAALDASAEAAFKLESVTVEQAAAVDPGRFSFVVLSDLVSLPNSLETALEKYVRGGGSVLEAAGLSTARRNRLALFGSDVMEARYYDRSGQRFLTTGDVDPAYPSLEKSDRWAGVRFFFALRVNDAGARVVARLTDQTPLLLEKKIGEGRVVLLASGLDNVSNDFPLHPAFVPFVEQTARYLSGIARRSGSQLVNAFLELRTANEKGVGVEVVDPQGRRPLSLSEAASAQSFQLTQAGFYEVRLANGRQDLIGVNPDRHESDLDVIPAETLALWKGNAQPGEQPTAGTAAAAGDPARPQSFWWYVMLLALAAAVAESLLASQYLQTQKEEP